MISRFFAAVVLIGLATFSASSQQPPEGAWSFAVSGDSRNCGDVVMPAIAAGALRNNVKLYWHLGDFRAMYGVDEDMQALYGKSLSSDEYRRIGWGDFLAHQIAPFGLLPVYLGIGNHELYKDQDKSKPQAQNDAQSRADFRAQFGYWLLRPEIVQTPLQGKPDSPEIYYHWTERHVDFINLDNADNDGFDEGQLNWLERVLEYDKTDATLKTVVVGMHRALPNSLGCGHSMNGDPVAANDPNREAKLEANRDSTESGRKAYEDLAKFEKETGKPVYVLASHSHFYMENIFQTDYWRNRNEVLEGWIVGTAGARRYALPQDLPPAIFAKANIYGYLLGTVKPDGKIAFQFQQLSESDVPETVQNRYGKEFVHECFVGNRDSAAHRSADSCNDK
ncbi:MAG TPA: hypothetical protein VMT20_16890 [Terriglobia bacterium]|nr:hypothetical protein [Terriglobia bacterium]